MSQYYKYNSNYVESSLNDKSITYSKYADIVYNKWYSSLSAIISLCSFPAINFQYFSPALLFPPLPPCSQVHRDALKFIASKSSKKPCWVQVDAH